MKERLVLYFFLSQLAITIYGQNGIKEGSNFLLQKSEKTISLNTLDKDEIKEIQIFSINKKSIYTTDTQNQVAILDTAKNQIQVYNIQSHNKIELTIPFDIIPKCLLMNNENIFIGGEMGQDMLVQYNLLTQEWYSLEIPTQLLFPRKAIDDLLVNDSALIAVDNLVMPKYVVYYKLNSKTDRLPFSYLFELKYNNSYESIYKARITHEYLGMISGGYNQGSGSSEHISIYRSDDMSMSFATSVNEFGKNYQTFNDIAIIGANVVIASKEKGLGILHIQPSYFKKSDEFGHEKFNFQIDISKIKYRKYKDENIIKLTAIPHTTKIILTIEANNGKLSHSIVDIEIQKNHW